MTRLELIRMIGDVITAIDIRRGSMLPNDPRRRELDDVRKDLDQKQLQLSGEQFDDATEGFKKAAKSLSQINGELENALDRAEDIVTTINTLKRFTQAVDGIIRIALPYRR